MTAPRLRADRLVLVLVGVFLVVATVLYYVIQRGKLADVRLATDKTLLSSLTAMIVVLTLALAGLLIRNLMRVVANWREGVLGARLQARMAVAFLLIVVVPTLIMFGTALTVVSHSLDDLVPPGIDKALQRTSDVLALVERDKLAEVRVLAGHLARELAAGRLAEQPTSGELTRWLEQARRDLGLSAAGIVLAAGTPLAVAEPSKAGKESISPVELSRVPEPFTAEILRTGRGATRSDELVYGARYLAAEPVVVDGRVRAVVWAAAAIEPADANLIKRIRTPAAELEALSERRVPVKNLYIALFLLVTLLTLFTAVSSGFLIARRVTEPILDLARGTDAIARGELDHRVRVGGKDELAQLASSFNRMASEVQRTRTEIERRRRNSETLLEVLPVGVISLDGAGRVSTVNRTALELLGLDALDPQGRLDEALGVRWGSLMAAIRPVIEGRTSRTAEEVPVEGEISAAAIETTALRYDAGDGTEGTLVILADLTPLRRAEQLAAWGEVARRMAHEIKNPLMPIRLSAERLLKRYHRDPHDAAPAIEEGVAMIVREVESLKRLVDEFSRFGRLPEVHLQPGDLNAVVNEAIAMYRAWHPTIQFRADLAPALPPHRLDREAMRRVLINILDNTVAAVGQNARSDKPGTILLRTYEHRPHRAVVLEVVDDGPGLSEEERARLFLPTFSRRPGGTGLGLAIVHRIVSEHGGRIRAEAGAGGGTRMVIELPEAQAVSLPARG